MKRQLDRIREDVRHGQGKIGPASAARIFDLFDEMIQRIENLERHLERLVREQREER